MLYSTLSRELADSNPTAQRLLLNTLPSSTCLSILGVFTIVFFLFLLRF